MQDQHYKRFIRKDQILFFIKNDSEDMCVILYNIYDKGVYAARIDGPEQISYVDMLIRYGMK